MGKEISRLAILKLKKKDVDNERVLVSNKISFGEKKYKMGDRLLFSSLRYFFNTKNVCSKQVATCFF